MLKQIVTLMLIFSIGVFNLFAEKSFERLGNEAEFSGDELYNGKKYAEAAEKYQEAKNNYQQAKDVDGIPIDEKISSIDDKIWKANYFAGNYEKTIQVLKRMLSVNDNTKTAKLIAQIYKKNLNNNSQAISFLKDYNQKKRDFLIEKKIATYYYDDEDLRNALLWFKKANDLKQDKDVIKNIATLHFKLGENEKAIQAYQDYLETNPPQSVKAKTYKNMGALYEDMRNLIKAREFYEKSNSLRYNKDITLKLIDSYYESKKYDSALSKIDLLLEKSPRNKNHGMYYRALIRYDRGDKMGAKNDFTALLNDSQYKKVAKQYIESIDSE